MKSLTNGLLFVIKSKKDFGEHIFAISWRLRRELGFTVRHHKALVPWYEDSTRFSYADQIHLDFYEESNLSWFVLKYINVNLEQNL